MVARERSPVSHEYASRDEKSAPPPVVIESPMNSTSGLASGSNVDAPASSADSAEHELEVFVRCDHFQGVTLAGQHGGRRIVEMGALLHGRDGVTVDPEGSTTVDIDRRLGAAELDTQVGTTPVAPGSVRIAPSESHRPT